MLGVPRELVEHTLNVSPNARPTKQKLCHFAQEGKDVVNSSQGSTFGGYRSSISLEARLVQLDLGRSAGTRRAQGKSDKPTCSGCSKTTGSSIDIHIYNNSYGSYNPGGGKKGKR